MSEVRPFRIGDGARSVEVGAGRLFLIAGPCVIESRDSVMRHSSALAEISAQVGVPIIFKASFDKANRTSHASFRGIGMEEGLKILAEARASSGLPVLTDVHETSQCAPTAEAVDVLQIPALLCRQTDLVQAAAATGKAVNIKKGQFLAPWDMKHALGKAREAERGADASRIMLTERGATFGYGNLVNDFRSLVIMRALGAPVIFDATHSVQLPGAGGDKSAGERRFIAPLARAAVAVGVDGLFMECHENPDQALSDGPNSLPLADLPDLLRSLLRIHEARHDGAP
ncbi:MAG TPA: 3-deoxy-8-phosphooctulonate synthase [Candidatus Limnocylindrales bacterium]|nr:3-deoxy-8-phosphooctulonate synthase [Candidatus Limnocylindrales bacterium]